MDDIFGDRFTADDWYHALGGMHALAYADGALVGHASVVLRRLLHGGRTLRAGYVEAVGVRRDRRRRGVGRAVLTAIEPFIHGGFELGALSATDEGAQLYRVLGWQRWRGPTAALTPVGVVRTAEADGAVQVLVGTAPLDLDGELTCDWREGDLW
jgi:aminoglycoside 2'-N-acetyltransferase I